VVRGGGRWPKKSFLKERKKKGVQQLFVKVRIWKKDEKARGRTHGGGGVPTFKKEGGLGRKGQCGKKSK